MSETRTCRGCGHWAHEPGLCNDAEPCYCQWNERPEAAAASPSPGPTLEEFLSVGWRYLHSIADGRVCSDRSCLHCRLADVLFEVEKQPEAAPAPQGTSTPERCANGCVGVGPNWQYPCEVCGYRSPQATPAPEGEKTEVTGYAMKSRATGEYRTSPTGGWSKDITKAYLYQKAGWASDIVEMIRVTRTITNTLHEPTRQESQ